MKRSLKCASTSSCIMQQIHDWRQQVIRNLLKNTYQILTDKKSLRVLGISKKNMMNLLDELEWKNVFGVRGGKD